MKCLWTNQTSHTQSIASQLSSCNGCSGSGLPADCVFVNDHIDALVLTYLWSPTEPKTLIASWGWPKIDPKILSCHGSYRTNIPGGAPHLIRLDSLRRGLRQDRVSEHFEFGPEWHIPDS